MAHPTMKNKSLILILSSLVVISIFAAVFTIIKISYPQESRVAKEGYYIGNLHTHTTNSDGKMSYDEAIEEAKAFGFDFIAITDHDTISSATRALCPIEKRILCIIGEEVSSKDGHILAIDITSPIPAGLSAEETIEKIHQQGGLAIPAHPGASNGLTIEKVKTLEIDAVECNPKTIGENNNFSCNLLPNFPYVYNSDAHQKEDLSKIANNCWLTNLNIEALKEAVKRNNCTKKD